MKGRLKESMKIFQKVFHAALCHVNPSETPVIFHVEKLVNISRLLYFWNIYQNLLIGLTVTFCKIVCFLDLCNTTLYSLDRREQ